MNVLSVENLSKHYGEKVLFRDISFGLEKGDKVALIARNGTGKSSLLRILAKKDEADSGNVTMRKDIRLVYLEQEPPFNAGDTILDSIFNDENPVVKLTHRYEAILEKNQHHPSAQLQSELQKISAEMDEHHAWDYEVRVRQVLSQLNIHNLEQQMAELSGGQRKRVALAKALLDPADILLLDEPTNHLDVEMVEWLETYLSRSGLSFLLVTHDRYFLDNVCTKIIELDGGKIYSYDGNYTYFLEKKAERETVAGKEQDKIRNTLRNELEWIRRMPKARGTKSKARVDAFYELKERMSGRKADEMSGLDVKMNRIGGKIIELKKVYKEFPGLPILKGFDYTFRTGERVGVVGKNGTGKTTFLNLLTGADVPDSGKINVGDTIVFGYYSQQGLVWKEDKRVLEWVRSIADVIQLSDGTKVGASQFLTMFQFPNDLQHTFISKLSGGEKRRLFLLSVLIRNPNFLILDEPTNDLDLLTLGILEEFLLHFRGVLVVVSHDRYFMNKLVDHLLIFEGNGNVRDFNGTYTEYRDDEEDRERKQLKARSRTETVTETSEKSEASKKDPAKLSYKERLELERLEKDIISLETEKKDIEEKLSAGAGTHPELIGWSNRIGEVIKDLDEKSLRWLELSERT